MIYGVNDEKFDAQEKSCKILKRKKILLSDVVMVIRRYEAGNFAPTSPKERHRAIKPLKKKNEKVFFSDPG